MRSLDIDILPTTKPGQTAKEMNNWYFVYR